MKIDDYAQSMFRYEKINAVWVTRCARYLNHVFGDAIKSATVVDYAFGRGNWSLAFREAGAAQVTAIDAAKSNVDRFQSYLQANGIDRIEVIKGNVLEKPIDAKADILWVYGILHHIDMPQDLLRTLTSMWSAEGKGLGLVYAYNDASLRQVVLDLARQALVYDSYGAFVDDALLFSHQARMRVRDDLTAPCVMWHSLASMVKIITSAGAVAERCVDSFGAFEKTENAEFMPHHILFSRDGKSTIVDAASKLGIDEYIIQVFGEAILAAVQPAMAKKFAVGLVNTNFDALAHHGYEKALVEDFLYLLYAFISLELSPKTALQKEVLELSQQSLQAKTGGTISPTLNQSIIATYLAKATIRI
jgi:hypothetical protein